MELRTESLKNFTLYQSKALTARAQDELDPVYETGEHTDLAERIRACCVAGKTPYPAQQEVINAIIKGFTTKRAMGIIAEMGCGKTPMASFISWALKLVFGHVLRTLIICPPILVSTWVKEYRALFGDDVRIVDINGPDALRRLDRLRREPVIPDKPEIWICGFNRIKTGSKWSLVTAFKSVYSMVKRVVHGVEVKEPESLKMPICPRCFKELHNLSKSHRESCPECGEPLWGPAQDATRAYPPATFIAKYLSRHFHLLIVDEVHQLKGSNTIQGAVLGQLASAIAKTLVLTGTLSGGKASDIFYLLQRVFALNFSREERKALLPGYNSLTTFISDNGSLERVHVTQEADPQTGRASRDDYHTQEKPGISPLILPLFLDSCAFLRISDIADQLPAYSEILEMVDMTEEMAEEYHILEQSLMAQARLAYRTRDMTVLGQVLHCLLAWPDRPEWAYEVYDRSGGIVTTAPALDMYISPKNQRVIDLALEAKAEGRNCIVYVEYSERLDAINYVAQHLRDAGLNPLVLRNVPAYKRLDWIEEHMATGQYDCLVTNPKMVECGMNLLGFPELLYWETGYNIYTLRQSARRSWRPGQLRDVVVRYIIYRGTMQEKAMSLIASKLEAALILEGELSDKGLVSLAAQGENIVGEMARALIGELEVEDLGTAFQNFRNAEAIADSVLAAPVTPAAQQPDAGQAPARARAKVTHLQPRLGRRIGSICGMENGLLARRFRGGTHVEFRPEGSGGYSILVNRKEAGAWTGELRDTVVLDDANLVLMPQPALDGMVSVTLYRLAA